jgi:hypothetical protein
MYLRYEEFDRRTGETRYRREYVPAVELARVRRWISRARAANARRRAVISFYPLRQGEDSPVLPATTEARGRSPARKGDA